MGAFKRKSAEIQRREGLPKKEADAIMAKAGRKKYGKRGMEAKAARGRKRAKGRRGY